MSRYFDRNREPVREDSDGDDDNDDGIYSDGVEGVRVILARDPIDRDRCCVGVVR